MSELLDIVQKEARIDEDKLRGLCSRKNIWDYFGIEKDTFLELSEAKKMHLQRNFTLRMLIFLLPKTLISALEMPFKILQELT